MDKSIQRIAIVSGGSRGLGKSIVEYLIDLGYVVATFSRSCTPFIEEVQDRPSAEKFFLWKSIDGTNPGQVKTFVKDVYRQFGRIDILINNAGVGTDGVLGLMRENDIERIISLNLNCTIFLTQACSKIMLSQQSGSIINISSVNAVRGHSGVSVYSATKAALDGFTRSLARELGPRNIRVNSIAPGYFESDMVGELSESQRNRIIRRTPLGRLGSIKDIVGLVKFLISPDSEFMTGNTIVVDGGITC